MVVVSVRDSHAAFLLVAVMVSKCVWTTSCTWRRTWRRTSSSRRRRRWTKATRVEIQRSVFAQILHCPHSASAQAAQPILSLKGQRITLSSCNLCACFPVAVSVAAVACRDKRIGTHSQTCISKLRERREGKRHSRNHQRAIPPSYAVRKSRFAPPKRWVNRERRTFHAHCHSLVARCIRSPPPRSRVAAPRRRQIKRSRVFAASVAFQPVDQIDHRPHIGPGP